MVNYSEKFAYIDYLMETVKEQADLDRYINECELINHGRNTANRVIALNEGFIDTVKNVINKLIGFVTSMWNRFIEVSNNFLKTDKGYLERYKDIILKKKPLNYKVQMYDYPKGIPAILSTEVVYFNYEEMVTKGKAKDKDTFIDNYYRSIAGNANGENFEDVLKSKFRGGDEQLEIPSDELNFTDMYNYCYTYDTLRKKIEKDKNVILKAGNDAIMKINSMVNSGQIKDANKVSGQQESFTFNDIGKKYIYYSHVNEAFILEADDEEEQKTRTADNSSDSGTNMKKSQNPAQAYRIVSPSDEEKNKAIIAKAEDINNGQLTSKEIIDRVKVFISISGSIFAAKLTASENAYKTYMKIIKAHVKDYVKISDPDEGNQIAKQGTNYESNENKNNNNENK